MTPYEREDCIGRIVEGFKEGLKDQGALLDDFLVGLTAHGARRLGQRAARAMWVLRQQEVRGS